MLHKTRLLVVDDEASFGEFVVEVAEQLGYTAKAVTSGAAFKSEFGAFQPSVCVIDMVMPELDGLQLVEWLGKQDHIPRTIVVSGYNPYYLRLANLVGQGRGVHVVATLKKPVSLAMLRKAIGPPQDYEAPQPIRLPEDLEASGDVTGASA